MTRSRGERVEERSGAEASLRSSRIAGRRGEPRLVAWTEAWPPALVHLAAAALAVAIGALDLLTGIDLSFSIFYLVPVSLAAWRLGGRAGAFWAAVAAMIWLAVDLYSGSYPTLPIEYWNASVRFGFFLIVAAALGRIRSMWETQRLLAGTDHLTGGLNSRAFHELVELERSRTLRYNRPFTLAYMDVDGFKAVNDRLGHSRGDDALQLIASTIRDNIRSMDSVARLGGDEFGLLFPEAGRGAAEVALRKIQLRLGEAVAQEALDLTFSIGAVICVGPPESVDRLIQRADALMYSVKSGGRNGLKIEVLDENFGIEAILRRS
ncbi:MAG: GGDEF domain-containing protein [Gemmatimonadetes bacterium]|nr:GGDEF domain-containing protein [Gemmatimonadota bacterium]